jgi:hypothetical protein
VSTERTAQASPVPAVPDRDEAKRRVARAWDRAIRACGYTNERVAEIVELKSATRVRRQRSDDVDDLDVIPTAVEILLADHDLGERFIQELRVERLAIHGEAPAVTPEQKLHRAMAATSKFGAAVADALDDGVLEAHEVPQIEQARAAAHKQLDDVGALFRGRKELIR